MEQKAVGDQSYSLGNMTLEQQKEKGDRLLRKKLEDDLTVDHLLDAALPYLAKLARGAAYGFLAFLLLSMNDYGLSDQRLKITVLIALIGIGGRLSSVSLSGLALLLAMVLLPPEALGVMVSALTP